MWKREPPLDRKTVDDIIRYLMGIDKKVESVLAILQPRTMRKLTPEETARLDQLRREQAERGARIEAALQRWEDREERRRRLVRRILRLGLPG
jgi:hypothetical protein